MPQTGRRSCNRKRLACRPEPRSIAPAGTLALLRDAMLRQHLVSFRYPSSKGGHKTHEVVPFGIIAGQRSYLVCAYQGAEEPYQYRLDKLSDVKVLDRHAPPPSSFDLVDYARLSFGTFQETPRDIVLRFSADAAADAESFQFHPTQKNELNGDGTLTVRFLAGGLRQIAHHLFTWGNTVTILDPPELRAEMTDRLDAARAALSAND